jgi:UDP-N-acetylglucosamine/UDP-N-acetylgalactosamine diphosphorylase
VLTDFFPPCQAYPQERVGVLALKDGRPAVIEYSEIAEEQSTARDPQTGMLLYNSSHIVLNNFSIDFIRKLVSSESGGRLHKLPFHIAKKQIPYWDAAAEETKKDRWGWKFELFVFDVFEFAENMQALEVLRHNEFSPLKNSDAADSDNPTTCRKHLGSLHKSWIEKAGGKVSGDGDVEVSATVSYDGEGLESIVKGKEYTTPVYIL